MSKPLLYKNGWELHVYGDFKEIDPKYEKCPRCKGSGKIVNLDTDELWKFDPPMKRCDKCGGQQNTHVKPEFDKPEVPAELVKRIRAVLIEFGKEFNDPNYKEPIKYLGDGI